MTLSLSVQFCLLISSVRRFDRLHHGPQRNGACGACHPLRLCALSMSLHHLDSLEISGDDWNPTYKNGDGLGMVYCWADHII